MAAVPIEKSDASSWEAMKPRKSKIEPTTSLAYIEGGPFYFALHGELKRDVIINPAKSSTPITPTDRARAAQDLCVLLSEGHIVGDDYQKPGDDTPNGFIKISDAAARKIQEWEAWAYQTMLARQGEWGIGVKSPEVLKAQFVSQLSEKDGSWAVSVKWFKDAIKVSVQDRDRPWVFRNGTDFDMKKGSRLAPVIRVGGIRIKAKEWSLQKLIVEKAFVITCGGNVAPDMVDEDELGIEYEEEITGTATAVKMDEEPSSQSAAVETEYDEYPDAATMIGE